MTHANPSEPVITKAQRHPRWMTIHGTNKGVRIAPTLVPALKIPVAKARSFQGNHSATVLMLAGNTPDSPNPNADLAIMKLNRELPIACPAEARLQKIIANA